MRDAFLVESSSAMTIEDPIIQREDSLVEEPSHVSSSVPSRLLPSMLTQKSTRRDSAVMGRRISSCFRSALFSRTLLPTSTTASISTNTIELR